MRRKRNITRDRVPAEELNLTPAEREMLADPNWVTKDEADAIIANRRRHEKTYSLEQVLRENGYKMER